MRFVLEGEHVHNTRRELRAFTMHAFAKFQWLLDVTGPFFTPEGDRNVRPLHLLVQKVLVLYSGSFDPFFCGCTTSNPSNYSHPRWESCYQDEDIMQQVSKIASRCHPLTMERVCLERYAALLELFVTF